MTVHDIKAAIRVIALLFSLALVALLTISASANAADDIVFFQTDIMGSAIVAVNEYGDLCWSESYTPYGDKTLEEDIGIGMPPGCGLLGQERGYTGHTYDYESGFTYAQQRYYDPSIGRFLSVDPIGINMADTRTVNRYSYAFNNPYRYTDPYGEHPADGIESVQDNPTAQEIEDGRRDGWGNLAPGYSQSDSDSYHSRSRMTMDMNPAIEPVTIELMDFIFNPFKKFGIFLGIVKDVPNSVPNGKAFPDRPLPRDQHGNPVPDTNAPHTQLGTKSGRNGDYPQAREFDANGKPVRDIDFTNHGRADHPNPHQHRYVPNDTGGTQRRGPTEPLQYP